MLSKGHDTLHQRQGPAMLTEPGERGGQRGAQGAPAEDVGHRHDRVDSFQRPGNRIGAPGLSLLLSRRGVPRHPGQGPDGGDESFRPTLRVADAAGPPQGLGGPAGIRQTLGDRRQEAVPVFGAVRSVEQSGRLIRARDDDQGAGDGAQGGHPAPRVALRLGQMNGARRVPAPGPQGDQVGGERRRPIVQPVPRGGEAR
ncbi:hypothetical protein ACIRD9_11690 [Streptomyces violaceus]|uniref:hypothetical protein n=1 Tax=Streptomyces violaceus TaxID=1936 RepID=UPI0038251024